MEKSLCQNTIETVEAMPQNAVTNLLLKSLSHMECYTNKVIRIVHQLCKSPEDKRLVTDLLNAEEIYCRQQRKVILNLEEAQLSPFEPKPFLSPASINLAKDIHISYIAEKEMLRIEMPELLPLKGRSSSYLPDKIRYAVAWFERDLPEELVSRPRPLFSPAFVLFIDHYKTATRMRDYDNVEFSSVLNAMRTSVLFNDSPSSCSIMHIAVRDEEDFSEVQIVPFSRMIETIEAVDKALYLPS